MTNNAADAPGAGNLVLNILWVVLSGFWLFLGYLVAGVIQCITIIAIPLGLGNFKMVPLALTPCGKDIVDLATDAGR